MRVRVPPPVLYKTRGFRDFSRAPFFMALHPAHHLHTKVAVSLQGRCGGRRPFFRLDT